MLLFDYIFGADIGVEEEALGAIWRELFVFGVDIEIVDEGLGEVF